MITLKKPNKWVSQYGDDFNTRLRKGYYWEHFVRRKLETIITGCTICFGGLHPSWILSTHEKTEQVDLSLKVPGLDTPITLEVKSSSCWKPDLIPAGSVKSYQNKGFNPDYLALVDQIKKEVRLCKYSPNKFKIDDYHRYLINKAETLTVVEFFRDVLGQPS